ncbi:dihydrolipoyllysine-residue acetyltransferase [Rothia nasimurium]|uniref:Dihydrolipoamide acetyltransferase component of pyruvate dehydrogenase complex n=1 Tax=Luteibacter anthropi TaxID=564369 RepID=A0A7X5U837_9GAMM|nr:2-oxo acid dehydrogenase subunit E2 [Luteibacter anthropi]NII05453.1 branched-chain alpha-keto acid dehydrogenase subunit E2 [Luteibacter anthropi]
METLVELRIPDLGGAKNVPLIEWLVAVGDSIVSEQEIATLESDKATMEVPSPAAGIVRELRASIGDVVSEGDVIALLGVISEKPVQDNPPAAVQPMPEHVPESPLPMPVVSAAVTIPSNGRVPYASPHVRRMARSLGLDIHRVSGSGRGGRIRPQDLDAERDTDVAVSQMGTGSSAPAPGLLPWPQVDHARFGDAEEEAFSRIRKMSAANLARNWALIPHVTHHDEADITELERFRKLTSQESGDIKVTLLAFLVKAVGVLLAKFPVFNASLDARGDVLILKKYVNIGFAADTPEGLVVPVIRQVDGKGIVQIAGEAAHLAAKAREGRLGPADMQGGCFSISSLGGIGGSAFTPIVNAPEVAILGVSRAAMKPVWDGEAFRPRLVLPLSLSYDHRVIDGAAAARFVAALVRMLEDFRRALL